MSVSLQFATKCAKCRAFMSVGTPVDFVKDGKGSYSHWHADGFDDHGMPMDGCELAAIQAKRKPRRQRFDIRYCANSRCYGHGVGFDEGRAPDKCPYCGGPWLPEDALEVAA